ncbi:MAG: hypothetical protein PW792_02990 [Acidobacteriaceae bacterium]|nr:hypothetical protein [Acidobacteriaceae bacterium]
MNFTKRILITASVLTLGFLQSSAPRAEAQSKHPFTVYGFIVYPMAGDTPAASAHIDPFAAAKYGIQPINLVYEGRLLDVEKSHPNDAAINVSKIDSVAESTKTKPGELVSLDMESWKRFDTPRTPALYVQVLKEFHKVNPKAKVGLYATVPQVTYGWTPDLATKYDHLNDDYRQVAALVDYFSPSLYNWDHALEDKDWERAAAFAIHAARAYDPNKPVLPYVTPEVSRKGTTTFLTYEQMAFRMQTLKRLGADGCIVWTGTAHGRKDGGIFDPQSGWAKALIEAEQK